MSSSQVVEIVEVIGRANAGVSANPFICRGENGKEYYVKLENATPEGLIAEWICGHLAREMGLPVAEFCLVTLDEDFAKSLPDAMREIGHGIGFGSLKAPIGARELLFEDVANIDPLVQADLLAFDAWIANEDRKLGPAGGNPNSMWVPNTDQPLVLIDHDSAFDRDFDKNAFADDHLAGVCRNHWLNNKTRAAWLKKASAAIGLLPKIWDSIPDEWMVNIHGDKRTDLTLEEVKILLDRPLSEPDSFWKVITS